MREPVGWTQLVQRQRIMSRAGRVGRHVQSHETGSCTVIVGTQSQGRKMKCKLSTVACGSRR